MEADNAENESGERNDERGVGRDEVANESNDATSVNTKKFRQFWLVASCVCLVAAAALWFAGNVDGAFVLAALGVIAWFLNVRDQLRRKYPEKER